MFGKNSVNTTEGQLHEISIPEPMSNVEIENIRDEASANIKKQQDRMKTRYDKSRCKAKEYKLGDLVMVQKQSKLTGESNKLVTPYSGPYRVTEVLSHDRYEVSSVEGYSKKKYQNVFSADKLKPWVRFTESESDSDEYYQSD